MKFNKRDLEVGLRISVSARDPLSSVIEKIDSNKLTPRDAAIARPPMKQALSPSIRADCRQQGLKQAQEKHYDGLVCRFCYILRTCCMAPFVEDRDVVGRIIGGRINVAKSEAGEAGIGFEDTLWAAADKLRGTVDAAEYKHVGMFVQSEKFVQAHGGLKTDISIFGQESKHCR